MLSPAYNPTAYIYRNFLFDNCIVSRTIFLNISFVEVFCYVNQAFRKINFECFGNENFA